MNIRGRVQGVGFRPHLYRLAVSGGLQGFVRNTMDGVEVEVEGHPDALKTFVLCAREQAPAASALHGMESVYLDPVGYQSFNVVDSENVGSARLSIAPDIALCEDCAAELRDPANRRYRYPFINCTNCGSSSHCPMTGPTRPCGTSRCVGRAGLNTRTR